MPATSLELEKISSSCKYDMISSNLNVSYTRITQSRTNKNVILWKKVYDYNKNWQLKQNLK